VAAWLIRGLDDAGKEVYSMTANIVASRVTALGRATAEPSYFTFSA
jgi:hypothetical protein